MEAGDVMVKRCPCGKHNHPGAPFCETCGQPLFDIRPTPLNASPETEPTNLKVPSPKATEGSPTSPPPKPTPVRRTRLCPVCGEENPGYAILCAAEGCGADLSRDPESTTQPTVASKPQPSEDANPKAVQPDGARRGDLLLHIGNTCHLCRDGDILGREGTLACEAFLGIPTVSRRHIQLERDADGWFLRVLSDVRNTTRLDGRELPRGEPVRLKNQHTLTLSSHCEVTLCIAD